MVKGTGGKFSQLTENRLTNHMIPNLWNSSNWTDVAIIIWKIGHVRLFYLLMCAKYRHHHVDKAHLNALQGAGAHPLIVCWHLTHVQLDTETQLLQASGLVAVSGKHMGSSHFLVLNSTRWTTAFREPVSTASTAQAQKPGGAASQCRAVCAWSASRHRGEGRYQLPGARSDVPWRYDGTMSKVCLISVCS